MPLTEKAAVLWAGTFNFIEVSSQETTHITETLSMVITTFTIFGKSYRSICYFDSFDDSFDDRDKSRDTINDQPVIRGNSSVLPLYKQYGMPEVSRVIAANL